MTDIQMKDSESYCVQRNEIYNFTVDIKPIKRNWDLCFTQKSRTQWWKPHVSSYFELVGYKNFQNKLKSAFTDCWMLDGHGQQSESHGFIKIKSQDITIERRWQSWGQAEHSLWCASSESCDVWCVMCDVWYNPPGLSVRPNYSRGWGRKMGQ